MEHVLSVCTICGEKQTRIYLKSHIASHERQISCTLCGISLANKVNLAIHMRRKHADVATRVKCSACDYKGAEEYDVKVHYKKRHTEDLNTTCEACGHTFKQIKKHLKRTNCGQQKQDRIKPPCDKCGGKILLSTV